MRIQLVSGFQLVKIWATKPPLMIAGGGCPASARGTSAGADILRSLDVTVLMVTHDLPYALELCPRSVVLSEGVVVADRPTFDVLTDEALMAAHRLELPWGFDPRRIDSLPA